VADAAFEPDDPGRHPVRPRATTTRTGLHPRQRSRAAQDEGQLPCEVVLLLEGEEESGRRTRVGRYVTQVRNELRPDAIVISDTTMYDENTPAITMASRDRRLEFTVKGPASDVHSGGLRRAIANPAMVVAQILAQCVSRDGKVLVPSISTTTSRPLEDWERESFRKLRFQRGVLATRVERPHSARRARLQRAGASLDPATFEVNGFFGGYRPAIQDDHPRSARQGQRAPRPPPEPGPNPRPGLPSTSLRVPRHGSAWS